MKKHLSHKLLLGSVAGAFAASAWILWMRHSKKGKPLAAGTEVGGFNLFHAIRDAFNGAKDQALQAAQGVAQNAANQAVGIENGALGQAQGLLGQAQGALGQIAQTLPAGARAPFNAALQNLGAQIDNVVPTLSVAQIIAALPNVPAVTVIQTLPRIQAQSFSALMNAPQGFIASLVPLGVDPNVAVQILHAVRTLAVQQINVPLFASAHGLPAPVVQQALSAIASTN